jgi:hypothetical protein
MKLIGRIEWGYVEFHWWNWLGLILALLGCVAIWYLDTHLAALRLVLGSWLDPILWTTLGLTFCGIVLLSRWTAVTRTH